MLWVPFIIHILDNCLTVLFSFSDKNSVITSLASFGFFSPGDLSVCADLSDPALLAPSIHFDLNKPYSLRCARCGEIMRSFKIAHNLAVKYIF